MLHIVAPAWTWLRTTIAKKTVLLAVGILLLINLGLITFSDRIRERVVQFWPVDGEPNSSAELPYPWTTSLNVSQFGERGNRVNRLALRADLLISNASLDRGTFEEILVTEFPYLTNALSSIYLPWNDSGDNGRPQQQSFVICTGSNNLHLAAHLIRSLRRVHNSQTTIEIAYAGDEDLRPDHRSFLAGLEPDILFIDLLQRFPAARDDLVKSGWAMKPFALLASISSRAILMDADAVFLTSPDSIFGTHPALNKTGTLFYHDRAARAGEDKRKLWVKAQLEAAGRSPSTYLATESLFYQEKTWWEQDSGVVAVDRANVRALLGLIFAAWMNTKTVRKQVTYQTFHGDKETYWLAMELSGIRLLLSAWVCR
ncbi:mannosyltransferase putative-domain-containing protein [Coniochaeta sp. 2T2.1]|nr:mannosyltransferase putative-domain-containing protein [Coniochaeta sp. 2T2.1]